MCQWIIVNCLWVAGTQATCSNEPLLHLQGPLCGKTFIVVHKHRNPENTKFTKLFQVRNFYYLWVKGFSTWEERDTIFLCWLILHRQLSTQPTHGARSAQSRLASPSSESRPSSSEARTQLLLFLKSQPTLPVCGVTQIPWSQFLSGIFILTSLNDTPSPRAREQLR